VKAFLTFMPIPLILVPLFPYSQLLTSEDSSDLTHVLEMRSEVLASSLGDCIVSLCDPLFPLDLLSICN